VTAVIGILGDKDARGIIEALEPVVNQFVVTQSTSDRAVDAAELGQLVASIAGADRVTVEPSISAAMGAARSRASRSDKGAVLVTGSITLIGDVMTMASDEGWKK
jgi:dihydrofolate synthase/folylpolyglutamate synthase